MPKPSLSLHGGLQDPPNSSPNRSQIVEANFFFNDLCPGSTQARRQNLRGLCLSVRPRVSCDLSSGAATVVQDILRREVTAAQHWKSMRTEGLSCFGLESGLVVPRYLMGTDSRTSPCTSIHRRASPWSPLPWQGTSTRPPIDVKSPPGD